VSDRPAGAVLPASCVSAKGASTSRALTPRVVVGLAAGASSTNPKRWPCEDSLAALPQEDGAWLLAVADAHFGGSSGVSVVEGLAPSWAKTRGAPLARLRATLVLVDGHVGAQARPDDPSETTALLVHVDPRSRRLAWANVGDSLLVVVARDGAARTLNETRTDFIGRVPLAVLAPPDVREVTLDPGDLVLLASDGLEPWVSDLELQDVGRSLRAGGPLLARVEGLLRHQSEQGRDNLALVAVELE
jgi:serine/threonine protein phosphatase PrpC